MLNTADSLKQFAGDYSKTVVNKTGLFPQVCHDPQWTSPCELASGTEGEMSQWQWQNQTGQLSFVDVEQALELSFNEAITTYYNTIYSGALFATFGEHQIELLQIWNNSDFERLSQNIIGHILMQRRLKQQHTVFIGCIVNGEQMLSIDNNTGAVLLEIPGATQRTVLCGSLSEFFSQAQPLAEPDEELVYEQPTPLKVGLMPRLKEIFNSLRGK